MTDEYTRISQIIKYIDKNRLRQPGLEKIADHFGLSPFHLQKIFKKWVGISPKQFLQYLTIEYARKILKESKSILEASFESGLSGPARMHDLFVTIDAMTPGEYKNEGENLTIYYAHFNSIFGVCFLAVTRRGICGLSFHDRKSVNAGLDDIKKRWPRATFNHDVNKCVHYFNKIFFYDRQKDNKPITLLLKGTNFQLKVWEALLKIPFGALSSYQDIAHFIGSPTSSRAVGNAVGLNPISFIIPCHRIIRKSGNFGNYHWGSERKKAILIWEAAELNKSNDNPVHTDNSAK